MGLLIALVLLQVYTSTCMDQLDIKFEWKSLDYQYPSLEARQEALDSKEFIPENNMPMGLEIYEDRLFVTVPRWRAGVPSSLNYISLKGNSTSPKLIPYPSLAAHTGKPAEIISPFRVRADRCGRLWVIDSGVIGYRENVTTKYPPAIIIYDLKSDNLLRKYPIPADQLKNETTFVNIAIEDTDCEKPFAYIIDVVQAAIVVYSWDKNESWRISHEFFRPDPVASDYNVNGVTFKWSDAIVSIGVDSLNQDNSTTLYFHPLSSYKEFSVSTMFLRNQSIADANPGGFQLLGNRGPNAQSSVSFLDPKTKVLFYALVNLNAVACWRTTNKDYNMKNQGRIYMNNQTMIYPSDIKVDYNDNLWIISNRLPIWMYRGLNPEEVNFRIFSAPVLEAISHTACDVKPRSDILDKFVNKVNNVTRNSTDAYVTKKNSADNSTTSPKLIPYPSWAAHSVGKDGKLPEIVSPFRVRADSCGRLWVLDGGKMNILNDNNITKSPPAIIVYDLKTDNLLRKYILPSDQVKEDSGFAVIAVEDMDCEKTYAYAGDVGKAGIVVYSWEKNESWRISHHFFHPDPLACDYNVKGLNFSWTDAIFGIALTAPKADNFSTLYFHPMSSYNEFSVSTEYLRNQSIADDNFNAFKLLGSRGPNAQSSASFVDPKTGVLFYSLVNLNAVACWRSSNKDYKMKNQGRIYMNGETMIYPSDIKVDFNDNLWILSNRLPIWMYKTLNPEEVNFRIFSAPVLEAISHTACDIMPRSDILDKFVNKLKNVTTTITSRIKGSSANAFTPISYVSIMLASCFAIVIAK